MVADSTLVGNGRGSELKEVSKKVAKEPGFTDVAVHGSPNSVSIIVKKGDTDADIPITHRDLARFLKVDSGYQGGKIRRLSCKTGSEAGSFAQNLANKMGVVVRAPSDTLFIYPNGKMVIGPDLRHNTGRWIDYYPQGKKR